MPGTLIRIANLPFIAAIYAYRITLGPLLGGQCRFHPTCSTYALEAYRRHGPVRGTGLTVGRLLRCQPFSRGGFDAVPEHRAEARCHTVGQSPKCCDAENLPGH